MLEEKAPPLGAPPAPPIDASLEAKVKLADAGAGAPAAAAAAAPPPGAPPAPPAISAVSIDAWREAAVFYGDVPRSALPERFAKHWTDQRLAKVGEALARCAIKYNWAVDVTSPLGMLAAASFPLLWPIAEPWILEALKKKAPPPAAAPAEPAAAAPAAAPPAENATRPTITAAEFAGGADAHPA